MIVLFDGVCNLCNAFVRFIIHRDAPGRFRFAPVQSEKAASLLRELSVRVDECTSVVLLDGANAWTESDAVLRIMRSLGGIWRLLYGLILIPKVVRDAAYRTLSRNRYRMFGRQEECMLPSPDFIDRFL